MGGARSISNGREADPATGLRKEVDGLYSHQDTPHTPPSDPKADVITKKKEKSHICLYNGPPVDNGRYGTLPDMPNKEDKGDRMNVGHGTEGETCTASRPFEARSQVLWGKGRQLHHQRNQRSRHRRRRTTDALTSSVKQNTPTETIKA